MKNGAVMAVQKIFWKDPYLTELNAIVKSADQDKITLDRTIAYAFSGGQSSDSGTIGGFEISKAVKEEKEIYYIIESPHNLNAGQEVIVSIDWEKRYKIMKLHFTAELILELVNQHYNHPEKIGAHITESKARLDFLWEKNISETFPFLREAAEDLINRDLEIISDFSDKENEKRYWEIKGFSKVACGGTHIKRTGEIGKIKLKRDNIGKGKERIEISLEG